MRATQMGVKLFARADARLLGGPIKSGHDISVGIERDCDRHGLNGHAPHGMILASNDPSISDFELGTQK